MAADADPVAQAEALAALPPGEPVAADAQLPALPRPSPSPRASPLAALVAAAPSHADAFLSHLYRCMLTRAGADTVLLFLCYATRLAGSVLETLSRPALRRSARRLVALAWKLPPATTVLLSSPVPQPPLAALALRLSGRLRAASAMLSETRTMGRLWGLLGIYFAAKKLLVASRRAADRSRASDAPHDDDAAAERIFDTLVAYAQMATLVSYQACENAAFLAGKKVLPLSPKTQARLGSISVRSWGLYVAMELGRLLVERGRVVAGRGGCGTKSAEWSAAWFKSFTRNLAWAPLTVHWSMREGPLPDLAVSLLAAYPSVGAMRDLWRETA